MSSPEALVELASLRSTRDLGVIKSPDLNHDEHMVEITKSCGILVESIFRCVCSNKPEVYTKLFNSLVLPKLLYCSPVWRPHLKKHVKLLHGVCDLFVRRLCYRYNVGKSDVSVPTLKELVDKNDVDLSSNIIERDLELKLKLS